MADDTTTLALISEARRALAEAHDLPDLRRLMAEAKSFADNVRRAARLAEGQHLAADAIEAANHAANEARAICLEAEAKAGEMLRDMAERGERRRQAGNPSSPSPVLEDLGISRNESSRWQQMADVPANTRREYVERAQSSGAEVTRAGLVRYHEEQAADRWAQVAPVPEENRYRLALATLAEQAGRVAEYDPAEAARFADDGTALVLESIAGAWAEWTREFQRARRGFHVVGGDR